MAKSKDTLTTPGLILVDKPAGVSSFGVIARLRKITGVRKMGHTGTLDPFATGLLPILVGRATRLSNWITAAEKTYEATVELGRRTDTGDCDGDTVETAPAPQLSLADIEALAPRVLGITQQTPPAYSAVKVNGKRAYKLAREGKSVDLPARPCRILSFEILSWESPHLRYRARVSKGVYIRVLSETIADMLGTLGVTTALRRTSIGALSINDATLLDDITPDNWRNVSRSPAMAVDALPHVELPVALRTAFAQGKPLPPVGEEGECLVAGEDGELWGVAVSQPTILKPKVVMIDNK